MQRPMLGALALVLAGALARVEGSPGAPAPVYYVHDQRIWRVEADGTGRRELKLAFGTAARLALAPRTGRLAFADMSEADGNVCVATEGRVLHRAPLPKGAGRVEALRWSPQGDRVAVLTDGGGAPASAAVHLLDAESGRLEPLRPEGRGDRDPTWSPDGTALAVVAVTRAWEERASACCSVLNWDAAIEVVTLASRARRRVVGPANRLQGAAWSPDGTLIAYASITDVYVVPAQGGTPTSIQRGNVAHGPLWSPDGRRVLVTLPRLPPKSATPAEMGSLGLEVVTLDPDGSARRAFDTEDLWDVAYSPDGQHLALLVGADRIVRVPLTGRNPLVLVQRAPWKPTDESMSILTEVVWTPER